MNFVNDPFYPQYLRTRLLERVKIERPELFEKLRKQEDIFIDNIQKTEQPQE